MEYTRLSLENQTNQQFLGLFLYEKSTENYVKQALAKYPQLPDNMKFITKDEDYITPYIKGNDYLYIVRIDCDNMYHKTFVQQIYDYTHKDETEVLLNQKGYIYNTLTGKLAHYFYESPCTYIFIYRVDDYISGKRYKLERGHDSTIKLKYEILGVNNFMIDVHSFNTCMNFNVPQKGEIIKDPNKVKAILKEFKG